MRSPEFKARQLWLEFVDATGIALRAIAEKIEDFRNWFKSWKGGTMKNKFDNRTLELNFNLDETETVEVKNLDTLKGYLAWMEKAERNFLKKLGFNEEYINKKMPSHLKMEKAAWKSMHRKNTED